MSEESTDRKNSQFIMMYLPIFKDKLAKREKRRLGHGQEAQGLRVTIAPIETGSPP